MSNKKILILEGGNNEEHDVSLVTSREIQKILNQNKLKFKTLRVNPKNFHKKIINYKNFVCISFCVTSITRALDFKNYCGSRNTATAY